MCILGKGMGKRVQVFVLGTGLIVILHKCQAIAADTHTHTHTHTYIHTHTHSRARTSADAHTRTCTHVHTRTSVAVRIPFAPHLPAFKMKSQVWGTYDLQALPIASRTCRFFPQDIVS